MDQYGFSLKHPKRRSMSSWRSRRAKRSPGATRAAPSCGVSYKIFRTRAASGNTYNHALAEGTRRVGETRCKLVELGLGHVLVVELDDWPLRVLALEAALLQDLEVLRALDRADGALVVECADQFRVR